MPAHESLRQIALRVAWNRALGLSMEDIVAQEFSLHKHSRATIYRALKVALQEGMLITQPQVILPPDHEELLPHVTEYDLTQQVLARFPSHRAPAEIIIVPVPEETMSEEERCVLGAIRRSEAFWAMQGQADDEDLVIQTLANPQVQQAGVARDLVAELVAGHREHPYTPAEIEAARRVGRAGAIRLSWAVADRQAQTIGVSYGRLTNNLSQSARQEWQPYGEGRERDRAAGEPHVFSLVGPLSGIPQHVDQRELVSEQSANNNAHLLATHLRARPATIITQQSHVPPTLAQDPALFRDILRYVEADSSVQAVFGGGFADSRTTAAGEVLPDPAEVLLRDDRLLAAPGLSGGLLEEADALITGVGSFQLDSRGPRLFGLRREDMEPLKNAGVVGDIAGRLLYDPTRVRREDDLELINRTNARFLTPTLGDFMAAARRARRTPGEALGTMVLATGADKAPVLRCLIEYYGAISVLVMDRSLALALLAA